MLNVEQIAERLNDRFRLLTGGRRTALPRQQTLEALIDWSWNLLDEKERLLLQRLSVFSGGWSLEAAQAVAGDAEFDEMAVFDNLDHLVNKSLMIAEHPAEGNARYRMLESIRQYARDKLIEAEEGETMRDRHADYYVSFAVEAGPHLVADDMLPWVNRIVLDLDNIRAVLTWTTDDRPALGLRLVRVLLGRNAYWLHPNEARAWLETAIENSRPFLEEKKSELDRDDFIKALSGLGFILNIQGKHALAKSTWEEVIQRAREAGELRHLAFALAIKSMTLAYETPPDYMGELGEAEAICRKNDYDVELAWVLLFRSGLLVYQGDNKLAEHIFSEATEVTLRVNNPSANANIFQTRSRLARWQGNLEEAKKYILIAIENFEAINDRRSVNRVWRELGHILREQGKYEEAELKYRKSIIRWQEQGQLPAVCHQLECFAFLAIVKGAHEHAAILLGASKAARKDLDSQSADPREIAELEKAVEQLAESMGASERDNTMEKGGEMDLDEAVLFALGEEEGE